MKRSKKREPFTVERSHLGWNLLGVVSPCLCNSNPSRRWLLQKCCFFLSACKGKAVYSHGVFILSMMAFMLIINCRRFLNLSRNDCDGKWPMQWPHLRSASSAVWSLVVPGLDYYYMFVSFLTWDSPSTFETPPIKQSKSHRSQVEEGPFGHRVVSLTHCGSLCICCDVVVCVSVATLPRGQLRHGKLHGPPTPPHVERNLNIFDPQQNSSARCCESETQF